MIKAYIVIFFADELKQKYFDHNLQDPFSTLGEFEWKFKMIDTHQPLDAYVSYKGENYIFEKTFTSTTDRDADYIYNTLGQYYIYTSKNDFNNLFGF